MKFTRNRILPVVSHGAEFLVQGFLMRRNILAYKAPPNNEGYDLICIHPDPKHSGKQLRIQVKSRYQTDSNRTFLVKKKTFEAFDYLIIAFLNIGFYYKKNKVVRDGLQQPEFYTLPKAFVAEHHSIVASGFERVKTRNLDLSPYKDHLGFETIANDLGIPYPHGEEIISEANKALQ